MNVFLYLNMHLILGLLRKIAKFNKIKWNEENELKNISIIDENVGPKNDRNKESLGLLFKDKKLRYKTILLCINWYS